MLWVDLCGPASGEEVLGIKLMHAQAAGRQQSLTSLKKLFYWFAVSGFHPSRPGSAR
jgi:hypothetical protein